MKVVKCLLIPTAVAWGDMAKLCIVISRQQCMVERRERFQSKEGAILCQRSSTNWLKYIISSLYFDEALYSGATKFLVVAKLGTTCSIIKVEDCNMICTDESKSFFVFQYNFSMKWRIKSLQFNNFEIIFPRTLWLRCRRLLREKSWEEQVFFSVTSYISKFQWHLHEILENLKMAK